MKSITGAKVKLTGSDGNAFAIMGKAKEASRKVIWEALQLLKDVNREEQNAFWLQLFLFGSNCHKSDKQESLV